VKKLAVGLDGFDSNFSGCTTHFTVFLIKLLKSYGRDFRLKSGPFLVRLNPNVPFKTRGNAAVSLIMEGDLSESLVERAVDELSGIYSFDGKGSAFILDLGSSLNVERAVELYRRSLSDLVPRKVALEVAEEIGGVIAAGERSLVGSLSALGYAFSGSESTFELLAYRSLDAEGERIIDEERVAEVLLSFPSLFNNVIRKRRRVVAVPRGPDPVLIGIRGTDPKEMVEAFSSILPYMEKPSSWCVFRTNQHTDPHKFPRKIEELKAYRTGLIEGRVSSSPEVRKGGHVFLNIEDDSGEIAVSFYSETYPMNRVASALRKGDRIRVLGGAVDSKGEGGLIFEAEKLWILELSELKIFRNPRCPRCGARMESAGRGKGYRCPKCGYRAAEGLEKEEVVLKRDPLPSPISPMEGRIRHLVKPSELEGVELPRIDLKSGGESCSI